MAKTLSSPRPHRAPAPTLDAYKARGNECAYANMKLLSRVLGSLYDETLKPSGFRASQLALMWAVVALQPVEINRLSYVMRTDQTTLSRTVETLRRARLVGVRPGADRRTRIVSATALGRRRFVQAMPYWEEAQRRAAALLSLDEVKMLARQVRHATRIPA